MTVSPQDLAGKSLICADGVLGTVAEVLVDPVSGRPTHLVWREPVILYQEISIPIAYVEQVDGEGIRLRVRREDIERLPRFVWR
ncbi:MAG: hypothetical protein RQ891_03760 [Thermoflexus sp.]|jgi:hypothetical protein|uniref:hypothetical protein n=1 Tax=Thermoflexus TaxID=1495649 RepID=UPI001C768755|nr:MULTISPECIES: hypothetical protein [Thermoflexus]MDT7883955.1 hypothetical protein [Thermoflexus sp.]MDT7947516.1 hypothetical protein [Thermoflexus sp.]QWK10156.1 MAG: hypothetical protein KNN16_12405 [Thermoflexus hugenholtzii]